MEEAGGAIGFAEESEVMKMSYESPIRLIENDLNKSIEDNVMAVILTYGIEVDREELIRALRFDREQYDRGYRDGLADRYNRPVVPYQVGRRWFCGSCSTAVGRYWKYCQNCGRRLGWEDVDIEDSDERKG